MGVPLATWPFVVPGDGYTDQVWIIIVLAVLVVLLVGWRLLVQARDRAAPSRPVDSGHPHLTDVDPHDV